MCFAVLISMVSSWLITNPIHKTPQPDNSLSQPPLSCQYQTVKLKPTPVKERVYYGNFSTILPSSSGLIPPSGVLSNAEQGFIPFPPQRNPVVMRQPVELTDVWTEIILNPSTPVNVMEPKPECKPLAETEIKKEVQILIGSPLGKSLRDNQENLKSFTPLKEFNLVGPRC